MSSLNQPQDVVSGKPRSQRHQKLPLIIALALTTMLGLFYTSSLTVLRNSIQQAEAHNTRQTVEGVLNVLDQTERDFSERFADWSSWDDTYTFIQDANQAYLTSNLIPQVLANLQVDLIAFIQPSGRIVYGTGFDRVQKINTPLPTQLRQHLTPQGPLLRKALSGQSTTGIILLPKGAMLITARPVLSSSGKGPTHGSIIFGRYLNQAQIEHLSKVTRLTLKLARLNDVNLPSDLRSARDVLTTGSQKTWYQPLNEDTVAGYTLLQDIYGQSILLLQVQTSREIYRQGQLSFRYLVISMGFVGLVFGCLIGLLVHHLLRFLKERQRMEAALEYEALHDSLTGLPNRNLFRQRLEQALELATQRPHHVFAVLFLDLDRFKLINDSMGHLVGDQLLIEISERLCQCLRPGDTCARLGGDEFAILLEPVNELELQQIVERIQEQIKRPLQLEGQTVRVTSSLGTILSTSGYKRPEDFLRSADLAMYRAKALGKDRHERFDLSLYDKTIDRLQIELDLRRAIENQEFHLYYQPIVSIHNQAVDGFEALIRWHHPDKGLISPAEFIPIAEETELIIPLGDWILEEACRQLVIWQKQFPDHTNLSMSVNISAKQFSQSHLVENIQQIIERVGIQSSCLHLEITESTIMENVEASRLMLRQLNNLGIHISIDDFGTGYSSLAYLTRFPIQRLKIDRSFIQGVDHDPEQLEIVRTIGTLGWNLGMDITAEGIETAKQLAQLKTLNCKYGQGYFFSKPLNREMATIILTEQAVNKH